MYLQEYGALIDALNVLVVIAKGNLVNEQLKEDNGITDQQALNNLRELWQLLKALDDACNWIDECGGISNQLKDWRCQLTPLLREIQRDYDMG